MNEAIRQVTHVQNIRYDKATERLYIIDQTLLPNEEKEIELRTVEEMIEAIKMLRIRGAPAIGICAGYCMYALARDIDAKDNETFYRKLQIDGELLGAARPTAVNLRWAVGEMLDTAKAHLKDDRAELLEALYRKAVDIHEDDIAKCTAISEYGLSLLKDGDGVLTHCNAGPLATSRYGTGQGPFLLAAERGMHIRVFADETRPLLQGARLTSYELQRAGVDVTLICDNMASIVMKNGWVQACFVGCDRVAANGDTANALAIASMKVAQGKMTMPFQNAFFMGVLCNILVTLGVLMSLAGKDGFSRVIGAWIPVCFFVTCGFNHSIADMTYCMLGLFGKQFYAEGAAFEALTWGHYFLGNMLPVTLGNIVGGCSVALLMWYCYVRKPKA